MYSAHSNGSLVLEYSEDTTISKYPNLAEFEKQFRNPDERSFDIKQSVVKVVKKKASKCNVKKTVMNYFPIIETFLTYNIKEYLPNDLIAGLTAGVMMIPQGMAFAALSTLPPIVGLYISFFASITYFFLGTGRQLSWGCIAILSLMMAGILDKYDTASSGVSGLTCISSNLSIEDTTSTSSTLDVGALLANESESDSNSLTDDNTQRRMEVAGSVSVVVGLGLVLASRIGLSRITALMSDSLITGFAVGISFHVATSQFKSLLGISIQRYKGPAQLIRTWVAIIEHIGETNVATLITSLICMLIIYIVKRHINERFKSKLRIPIPIELFVIIAATLASNFSYLNKNYGVTIVEEVPTGVPGPKFPDFVKVTDYIGDATVIIIVSYAQSLAMAKTMALKHNYHINVPQEMLACGLCSVMCGLFSGYITGASVSRSVVQDGAGGKTQLASLFAAGLVLLVIMVMGPYFYYLPKCVLSAIIVVNLRSMFLKLLDIPKEWRKSRYDCCVWVFTCLATVVLDPAMGLLAGVVFSLFLVVIRSMIQPVLEMGQIQTSAITVQLRSLKDYSSAQKLNNVKILLVKTPLYFINSEIFSNAVLKEMDMKDVQHYSNHTATKRGALSNGVVVEGETDTNIDAIDDKEESTHIFALKVLILDMSGVSFIDVMGVKALELLMQQAFKADIALWLTNIPENLFSVLQSTGFWKKHADKLYITNEAALSSLAEAVMAEDNEKSSPPS